MCTSHEVKDVHGGDVMCKKSFVVRAFLRRLDFSSLEGSKYFANY